MKTKLNMSVGGRFTLTGVLIGLLSWLPNDSRGDVLLTGLLQHGTEPGQSGQSAGSPIWNTLGNEVSFANIYLTQPNGGYTAPFLNSGNGAATSISYSLTPGTYDFYFFTMGFWNNNPGEYGLNLFFDGDNTNPGIAAWSVAGVSSVNATTAGIGSLALNGSVSGFTPTPADLIYTAGGLNVSLTAYGFGDSGVFGGPALDRVGNLDNVPDLALDSVGYFRLEVTPVPEPSAIATGCLAAGLLLAFGQIRRKIRIQ